MAKISRRFKRNRTNDTDIEMYSGSDEKKCDSCRAPEEKGGTEKILKSVDLSIEFPRRQG